MPATVYRRRAAINQAGVDKDHHNGQKPADHQIQKKGRVTKDQKIFVKDMNYRIIDQEKAQDEDDYPPLFFIEYIAGILHR